MPKIVIPYFSASGHTRKLAQAIYDGASSINPNVILIDICKIKTSDWQTIETADGLIFGAPTFMGSLAGEFKLFLDQSSSRGLWTKKVFINKLAAGFTVAGYPSGDKLNTMIQLAIYAAQHGMIWVNHCDVGIKVSSNSKTYNQNGAWLGLMATSISDKSQLISEYDIKDAFYFGARFAKSVNRWNHHKIEL